MEAIPSGVAVMAITDAVKMVTAPDVVYASDAAWWASAIKRDRRPVNRVPLPHDAAWVSVAQKKHGSRKGVVDRIVMFKYGGESGWDPDPWALRTTRNSGGAAIQVAAKLGATRIVLLGYDMSLDDKGHKHFGDENRATGSDYSAFRRLISTLAEPLAAMGVTVVNASRRTKLTCFPCMSLAAALQVPPGTECAA